ncbi:MAG: Asp-tRNA(Asn)/Glu-tRNA(Gln) amidotransferase subunit GatB [Anaerolineales bacterium]|nr:Asp-tRNA(Asn)/Glu-tRNA(Gln) amidotransferase subunit GatB [Anaerolineales bacterium]
MPEYEAVIGLETHIQLNTTTKIFCACKADSWDDGPNTNICPVCTGMPGVLPVLNKAAVEKAVLLAAAMHADIQNLSFFDRKNYFYPDLPKGYQISQYDRSIARGGFMYLPLPEGARQVRIHKLHLEEDAGKTKNEFTSASGRRRLIDFNRCGVPLIEMVTGPDIHTADEAAAYLIRLRQLLRWLGVSEADMEKGHLRADANVSIRLKGSTVLNTKTEIKNVNSIEAVRSAIEKEIERQIREVEAGHSIKPWTLSWDDETQTLSKMRSKETEADYRYFREPDLLPVRLDDAWRAQILATLPELPLERRARFVQDYGLPAYDAEILTGERALSDYFEAAVKAYGGDPKTVSNWMMNDVLRMLNDRGLTATALNMTPAHLAEAIRLVDDKVINTSTGKALVPKVQDSGKSPKAIVEAEGLAKVSDEDAIRAIALQVLDASPAEVASYKAGKTTLMGWFVGQVMRQSRGKADPQTTRTLLEQLLQ